MGNERHFNGPLRMQDTEMWLRLTEEAKRSGHNKAPMVVTEHELCNDCLDSITERRVDEGIMA